MNRHVLNSRADDPARMPSDLRLGLLDDQWVVATEDANGWVVLGTADRIPAHVVTAWTTLVPAELEHATADRSVPGIPDEVFSAAGNAARGASAAGHGFDAVVHHTVRATVDAWLLAHLGTVRSGYAGGAW